MSLLDVAVRLPLDRFALDVAFRSEARVLGVFGASGSGKSSLLEVLAGVRRAQGQVKFRDEVWLDDTRALPPERRGVGWVPQDGLLFPRLSVRQNLAASRRPKAGDSAALARALRIDALLDRAVETLSGGERQRVALGRALGSAPRLLLLDEPFGALDLPLRRSLLPFLRSVTRRLDVPVVLVSHDPVDMQVLCDEVVVIEEGRVVAHGDPKDVLAEARLWQLGADAGYANVLPCTALEVRDQRCQIRIGDGPTLSAVAPRGGVTERDETLVEIAARDVIVATTRPVGLSARNVVDATVREIRDFSSARLLDAELAGGARLRVELTADAIEALALAPGVEVLLVIKSTACRVHPSSVA